MTARRYLMILQDPRGYPPPGGELDPAPPEGPEPPVLHSVVLADDFERVGAEVERLREAGRNLARWTEHDRSCARSMSTANDCTCGLQEAWSTIDASGHHQATPDEPGKRERA